MNGLSVHEMIHGVLANQDAKLEKRAAAKGGGAKNPELQVKTAAATNDTEEFLKVAKACDFLAENLHIVVDKRTPQEKLAEYMSIRDQLAKVAEDPPMTPPMDSGGTNIGGPGTALQATPNTTTGESLKPGESGQATPAHQSPASTAPGEKVTDADAPTALPTNKDMQMAEQPIDVLKQAGYGEAEIAEQQRTARGAGRIAAAGGALSGGVAGASSGGGIPARVAKGALGAALGAGVAYPVGYGVTRVGNRISRAAGGEGKKEEPKKEKEGSAQDRVREKFSKALLGKFAEDALFPAQISAGTTPILQSAEGANPAQMQGTEVFEGTPRETAPTDYQGAGRDLIASNEAAINYTKGEAKSPQKKPLAELLTEPAMSSAHDSVLNQSFDSTSQAGVKISSARELLKKAAASSPELKSLIDAHIKQAMDDVPPPGQELAAAAPGEGGEAEALGGSVAPEVSDEALAAAAEGVTVEELAAAQELLAMQAGQAGAAEEAAAEQMAEQVPQEGPEMVNPAPDQAPAQV